MQKRLAQTANILQGIPVVGPFPKFSFGHGGGRRSGQDVARFSHDFADAGIHELRSGYRGCDRVRVDSE
jgi:hypothetical protein